MISLIQNMKMKNNTIEWSNYNIKIKLILFYHMQMQFIYSQDLNNVDYLKLLQMIIQKIFISKYDNSNRIFYRWKLY